MVDRPLDTDLVVVDRPLDTDLVVDKRQNYSVDIGVVEHKDFLVVVMDNPSVEVVADRTVVLSFH